jgi:hypothetical protein
MTSTQSPRKRRHLALLGGFRYRGENPAPDEILCIAAIGGADVDLTLEQLPPVTTITKFSLVGGVKLRVPADAEVDIDSFKLVGGRGAIPPAVPSDRPAPVVRVRFYGIVGGVSVQRG